MTKTIVLKKCICDICKKVFEIEEYAISPLATLTLPMSYYDEYGSFKAITVEDVEVCKDCLQALNNLLSTEYTMRVISCSGLSIKKKGR